ncbi:ABC transporter substrate-binding protein [Paramicrobacterium fandaimingii]|uniref:ABC transporter substrate-binding protein n=1 Tax=Paramicrobacterium fandaimingii TaxID=2708079 RepID=UPI00142261BF|nr:sugar ABC transporter substrate-binding protein [Microbacterium fandaimingii]
MLFPQTHAGASEILKKDFEAANPGVTVNVTLVPYEDLQQKATLDVQSGAAEFDVFDSWYTEVGALAAGSVIVPLDDMLKDADDDDFIPAIYDAYSKIDGKRYSIPFDGDTEVLFYNKEILERNGVEPPTTWNEYADAVAKITEAEKDDGVYGAAIMGQQTPIILMSTYANRLAGFGGGFLDEEGNPTLDTEAAIGAAASLNDVVGDAMPTPLETGFDQALQAFLSGKVAFMEFWTDLGTFAQDESQSKIVDKWGVMQLPVGGDADKSLAALDAGYTMTLSSAAKNPDLAKKFMLFATSAETNLKLITSYGSGIDPNRLSTLSADEYKEFNPQVQEAASASLNGALPWPTSKEAPELFQALTDELATMISTNGDAESTMKKVQSQWESILG